MEASASKLLLVLCVSQFLIIIALHIFYNWQVQKLLDKLMSRDFRDYSTSVTPPKKKESIQLPEVPEDLRVLQGFQIP